MGKKRRLGDLYRTHRLVECDDGTDDKILVNVVKVNRPDTDSAVTVANAARSRILMRRDDRDSDLWLECYGDVVDRPRSELVGVLISDDLAQKRLSAEAEEAAKPRWADDDYLDGLRELWADELMMKWASDPEDPDAKKVYDELAEFRDNIDKRMEGEPEDLAEKFSHLDDEELRAKVVAKLIDSSANLVWINEFEMQRVFYATREMNDRSKRYFSSIDEVRDLDERIYNKLHDEYEELSVDVLSGKESPATQGSSPPSEPSVEEEASPDSGPETSTTSKTSPTNS